MFKLDDRDNKEFSKWKKEHDKTCKFADLMNQGAIGGRFTYSFTPTGLGCIVTVKCGCGEELNLTHEEEW